MYIKRAENKRANLRWNTEEFSSATCKREPPKYLLYPAVLLQGVRVGIELSKPDGTCTLYHSFLMKAWALEKKWFVRHQADKFVREPQSVPQKPLSESSHAVRKGCPAIQKYLRLLLSLLILEVLGVLTSSHCLKFCSNTYRKGYLLINNRVLNILPLYRGETLQIQSSPFIFFTFSGSFKD